MKTVYSDDKKLLEGIERKKIIELKLNELYAKQAQLMSHGAVRYVMDKTKKLSLSSGVIVSKDILADETWLGLPCANLMGSEEICTDKDREFIKKMYQDVHQKHPHINFKAVSSVFL